MPQPEENLRRLTGEYQSVTRRFGPPTPRSLSVRFEGGRLYLLRGQRRDHLIPLGPSIFRRPFEPLATTAFVSVDGKLFLQGPFGNYQRTVQAIQ
jgi:hypothetical protein